MLPAGTPRSVSWRAIVSTALSNTGSALSAATSTACQPGAGLGAPGGALLFAAEAGAPPASSRRTESHSQAISLGGFDLMTSAFVGYPGARAGVASDCKAGPIW